MHKPIPSRIDALAFDGAADVPPAAVLSRLTIRD